MADRTLKRAWLRLIGAVDDHDPSPSALKVIDSTSIDATLGAVQDDDTWVALACLDAIQNRRDVADDLQICKHILQLGLRRSEVDQDPDLGNQAVLHTLAIRYQLYNQLRLLEIWEKLYATVANVEEAKALGGTVSAKKGDVKVDDDEDDFDAWADVAETTPSPLPMNVNRIGLADFLRQDTLNFIMQLARVRDAQKVAVVIKSLSKPQVKAIYPYRLKIGSELLLYLASAKNDLRKLVDLGLLPGMSEKGETGLIVDCLHLRSYSDEVIDRDDVQEALFRQKNRDQGTRDVELTSAQLLRYYQDHITSLQSERLSTLASLQLTEVVSSGALGLQADESMLKTSQELKLLLPLTSSRRYHHWTLEHFRNEILACHDFTQKQRLAKMYLEDAHAEEEVVLAIRDGVIPYLHYIGNSHLAQTSERRDAPEHLSDGLQQALLALADEGNIRIIQLVLESSANFNVDLGQPSRQGIVLSCILAACKDDLGGKQGLSKLLSSKSGSVASNKTSDQAAVPLVTSTALFAPTGAAKRPSEVFKILSQLDDTQIEHQLHRSRKHLRLCQQLSNLSSEISPALLADMQGDSVAQEKCIIRLFHSFAKMSKANDQCKQLIEVLVDAAGPNEAFDAISPNDVVRISMEGVLSAGVLQVYNSSLKTIFKTHVTAEEEERIILNASREYYDNAISTNVHQGDMKMAYEILSVYGSTLTPRIERERAFIEATSRLCSFRIQSNLRSGSVVAPIEIRLSQDRLEFVKKLLESKEDAYKTPDLILELATKLCAIPSGSTDAKEENQMQSKIVVESRTLALLTEAALGQADYTQAQISCERLVTNIQSLTKRLQQSLINKGVQNEQLEMQCQLVRESAYRTCFLLCNQHEWNDYASRLRWASFVLAYCPEEQIDRYLKTWRQLEEQFQQDLIAHPPPNNWDQMATHLKAGQSGGLAGSLAAIGNFGGLESLGPFGNLFANAKMSSVSTSSSNRATASEDPKVTNKSETGTSPPSRTAKLFDSLGSGQASSGNVPNMTYLDPAERAARAARRFFGGFGS